MPQDLHITNGDSAAAMIEHLVAPARPAVARHAARRPGAGGLEFGCAVGGACPYSWQARSAWPTTSWRNSAPAMPSCAQPCKAVPHACSGSSTTSTISCNSSRCWHGSRLKIFPRRASPWSSRTGTSPACRPWPSAVSCRARSPLRNWRWPPPSGPRSARRRRSRWPDCWRRTRAPCPGWPRRWPGCSRSCRRRARASAARSV